MIPESPAPLIVSLGVDAASFAVLDGLRRRYFPPERNHIAAHITLFHALPGDTAGEAAVRAALAAVTAEVPPFPVRFPAVRSLGRGVALAVEAPELLALRRRLAASFEPWLSAQDRQKFQPHVTIQNKVTPEAAKELYTRLAATWEPFTATAESLQLWRYRNGPWEAAGEYGFTDGNPAR